jgi:hypothetical protein
MKKITLALIGFYTLIFSSVYAQTYSTGVIELLNDGDLYTAEIDVTSSLVTLTLSGPDGRYLGLGFGVQSMTTDGDVVIFLNDGTFKLTDRYFGDNGSGSGINVVPILDTNQDWSIVSNTLNGNQRTIIATRLPDTGDTRDYVFSTSDTSIDLVWSIGFDYGLFYHGPTRGKTMQSFTLSNPEVALNDFKISPNPAKSKVTISLPNGATNVKLDVFDVLGKKVMTRNLSSLNSTFDVSKWNTGIYLMRITSDNGTQTKRFVKQ